MLALEDDQRECQRRLRRCRRERRSAERTADRRSHRSTERAADRRSCKRHAGDAGNVPTLVTAVTLVDPDDYDPQYTLARPWDPLSDSDSESSSSSDASHSGAAPSRREGDWTQRLFDGSSSDDSDGSGSSSSSSSDD